VAFLQAHKNSVALITIDIGANEVLNCFAIPSDMGCLANGLTVIKQNLPTILTALRAAAGKDVPIVGMNCYNPHLAHWLLQGKGGVVTDSLKATLMLNDTLAMIYTGALLVPDVEGAFSTTHFTPKVQTDFGTIPLNVALICQWTWMCPASGIDSYTHPNTEGYGIIAGAIHQVLPPSVSSWLRHSAS
jgi:lysophospholipase L1-like esterase